MTDREKYMKIGRGAGFNDAVKQMDEYISNPSVCLCFKNFLIIHTLVVYLKYKKSFQKFRAHASAKPVHRQIRVKTELEFSLRPKPKKSNGKMNVVKVEMNAPERQSEVIALQNEKKTLIDKIVVLKSENQHLLLQLRNEQSEKTSLESKLQKMQQEIDIQSSKMNQLRSELSEQCANYTKKCAQNETEITRLLQAKRLLEARNNQLKRGIDQQKLAKKQNKNENDDDDVYEVEKLVDHKMKNGIRFYLVHWAGYSEQHDTWEKEDNLDCPELLNTYNDSISKKKSGH